MGASREGPSEAWEPACPPAQVCLWQGEPPGRGGTWTQGASSPAPSQAFLSFALVFCALVQAAFWRAHSPTQVSAAPSCGGGPLLPLSCGHRGRQAGVGTTLGHSLPAGRPSAGLRAAGPGAGRGQAPPRGPEDGTWGVGGGKPPRPAGLTGVGESAPEKCTFEGCTPDGGRAWPGERPVRSRGCGTGDGVSSGPSGRP